MSTTKNYQQLQYTLRFVSPAFLGNAEQSAQWRTPPIKALLRQWWRVVVAPKVSYKVDALRQRENALFGVAADGSDSHKSLIRIRLSHWDAGKLDSWAGLDKQKLKHPEVPAPVGAHLYLGYGPLTYQKNSGTSLKTNAAIQAGEEATLSLAVPQEYAEEINQALALMNRFGTLGGRSRNGWGSFVLLPKEIPATALNLQPVTRDWKTALGLDWPHALGATEGLPLIWQTQKMDDWKQVMASLAQIKINLRTQFKFPNEAPPHRTPEDRHWLSYPVTKHAVRSWGNNARLPNSLRFKVQQTEDGKLCGLVFHVPCKPPAQFNPDPATLQKVWQRVHQHLDQSTQLQRVNA